MTIKTTPNFAVGRSGHKPEIIVIHVAAGSLTGTDSWFANPASQVSAHYGIGLNGEVHQYVKDEDTAWHAGRVSQPSFKLYKQGVNPNLYTIGIEHEGFDLKKDSTPVQKAASAALIKDICVKWGIPCDRDHVIGHFQVYSLKPNCPSVDKSIIDELISQAKAGTAPTLADGIAQVEAGLAIIKKNQ